MLKERKKWFVVCGLCLVVLSLPGCEKGGLTPDQLVIMGEQLESLSAQLVMYQAAVTEMGVELEKSGVIDANSAAKLAKFNKEVDRITPQIREIAAAVKAGEYSVLDDDVITLLKALKQVNLGTSSFNKYATLIDIALAAIITILGFFVKKKSTEAKLASTNLKASQEENRVATITLGSVAKVVEKNKNLQVILGTDSENKPIVASLENVIKPNVADNLSAAGISAQGKALISQVKAA